MNTLITQQENIQNHRFKQRLYPTGKAVSKRDAGHSSPITYQGKAVRQKNGFEQNSAPAPETIRLHYGAVKKNEYTRFKSPSNVSFGGLSSNKTIINRTKRFISYHFINVSKKLSKSNLFQKVLEKAEKNNALCAATAVLATCGILRPATIMSSSSVEMENRKIAASKSIASGLIGFILMFLVSKPFEHAFNKMSENPAKYLKEDTIKNLAGNGAFKKSKNFKMATRFFKMSSDIITAAPKGSLTIILIPPILNLIFKNKKKAENITEEKSNNILQNYLQDDAPTHDAVEKYANQKHYVFFTSNQHKNNISFKGAPVKELKGIRKLYDKFIDLLSKGFGKLIDKKGVQEKAKDLVKKDSHIETHVMAVGGTIVSSFYVINTLISKKIEEYRKKPLIYNSIISWAIATGASYTVDNITNGIIEKFKSVYKRTNRHIGKDTIEKHITGIKILKSAIIVGTMYRWLTPWFSTILAEKVWKKKTKNAQPVNPQSSAQPAKKV